MENKSKLPYPFLRNCAQLIFDYDGKTPFHLYLKQAFKLNPGWGSKDRKNYRKWSYYFWRHAQPEDRTNPDSIVHWLHAASQSSDNKVEGLKNIAVNPEQNSLYPWQGFPEFSKYLDAVHSQYPSLNQWFQTEPPVWIKVVNKKYLPSLYKALDQEGIEILHEVKELGSLAVPNQSNLNVLEQQGLLIIQDIGSQQSMILDSIVPKDILDNTSGMSMVWDACSGSGGKALSLRIQYPQLDIQCSDIRQPILDNLQQRFDIARLAPPFVFKHDLAQFPNKKTQFKIVLADIPCSGSGTWRRNPEEKWFFNDTYWISMLEKQASMIQNAAKSVTEQGYLIVCTCSIFARENEQLIDKFLRLNQAGGNPIDSSEFEIVDQRFLGGIEVNGDYIFRTILRKQK